MARRSAEIEKTFAKKEEKADDIRTHGLSSGISLLDLAVSQRLGTCVSQGQYLWFVGDSSTGKTWIAFQFLAEAARNPHFDEYRFIYDNVENGALFDVAKFFGKRVRDRLEYPHDDDMSSQYMEQVYFKLMDLRDEGRPFIYIVDSWDFLDTLADEDVAKDQKAKFADDKMDKAKGSMGMHKAKLASANMKRAIQTLNETGSILIGLSQTRDKVNTPFPQKTAGGGRVHKFGAHVELWSSSRGIMKRTVGNKDREFGKFIQIDVEKNRVSGWEGKIVVPFLRGHGFDGTGAAVDFLIEEGHWKKAKATIDAAEFGVKKTRENLITFVEDDDGRMEKLDKLVAWLWRKIDSEVRVVRHKKYD